MQGEINMLFVDYTFSLIGENILMDDELTPEHIKVKDGDKFEVVIKNNQILFRKITQEVSANGSD
jgi:hypothetical protein